MEMKKIDFDFILLGICFNSFYLIKIYAILCARMILLGF